MEYGKMENKLHFLHIDFMERNRLGAKSSVLQMKARSDSNVQKKWFCHRPANALLVTPRSQNQKRC